MTRLNPGEEEDPLDVTPGFKRKYADRSLGYLYLDNGFRRLCIRIQEATWQGAGALSHQCSTFLAQLGHHLST